MFKSSLGVVYLATLECQLIILTNHHPFVNLQAKYIAQCVEEIKEELRHDSLFVKANAISKLTYVRPLVFYSILSILLTFSVRPV